MSKSLTIRQLACYGGLGLPQIALLLPLTVFLPPYYAKLPGMETSWLGAAGIVGVVLFIGRLWDLVTDLGVGWASDQTRTRFGRRRPWIVGGAPILLLGTYFLFSPPDSANWAYLLGWTLVAYLGWSMLALPYQTWGAELSSDYDERSRVTASREIFAVVGTLVAIILPTLFGADRDGSGSGAGLQSLFWFLLITLPIALLALLWGVKEPEAPEKAGISAKEGWALLSGNKPFRRLLLAYLLNGAANGIPATLFLFFVTQRLEASEQQAGIALVIFFLSAVVGLPLWLWIGRSWSKHRLWCASMIWVSVVFSAVLFMDAGDYIGYLFVCVLGGAVLGVDQAIPSSMQADVIDEDTANGGGGRAGLYFGLWGMATKLALAIAIGVTYVALDLAGFDANGDNDATALWTLTLLYGALPVLIKLCVLPLVWNFPLDRQRHADLQQSIGN